jgi:hypothetical protein
LLIFAYWGIRTLDYDRTDPLAVDLAWELREIRTRLLLALQGSERTWAVICTTAEELAFSLTYPCHRWLGPNLGCLLQLAPHVGTLTPDEMCAIRAMASRRLEQREKPAQLTLAPGNRDCLRGDEEPLFSRPWEIYIFSQCASQDPWISKVVAGSQGSQSLLSAFRIVLSKAVLDNYEEWGNLDDIVHDFLLLLVSSKFADMIGSEPGIIELLPYLLRYATSLQTRCCIAHMFDEGAT